MRPTEPPLPTPSRFGRYELRAVLGRGGGGVVYEAVLHGLGGFRKRVALKVLGAADRQDEVARAALQREARVGALLSHPNVVAILDLGREQDRWYIAMELVDGHPVSVLLRAGLVDAAALLEIGVATCAGLAHIHDLRIEGHPGGLVHRDIKPQNLLVDRNGTLKVADFGIAALASSAGDRAGTPTWMAPEQQSGRVGPAADLFALGAVLYALAARRPPFGVGETALANAPRVETFLADPAFLAPVDAALPGLGAVVRRCLRLDPAERPASAQALAADLRALRALAGWSDLGTLVERAGADAAARRTTAATPRSASSDAPTHARGLVGRSAELAALATALQAGSARVALTGPGGVGKTRLAKVLADRITDGPAVWVELGDAPDADGLVGLARAVGRALGLDLVQGDPVEQVAAAAAARARPVVFLDGADGAREEVVALLDRLLVAAPDLRAVVTSRTAPRAQGEQVFPVPPLPTADGVALFELRVATPLPPTDKAALPPLIEALDGLPLAIELAAARARTLGVPQILERMRDRFRLLVDPARPGTSLRSTLAASFALLRPWEARALAELSVFPADFALEAAEAVVRLDEWPEAPWALDVLASLLEAALVRLDRATGRFALLHSVREFAAGTLDAEQRRAAEVRHGEHYAQLGAPDIDEALRRRRPDHVQRVESELDNLRTACERAVGRGDARVAERAARAAAAVYLDRGPFVVGATLLDRVLALPDLRQRGRLLAQRWGLLRGLGRKAEAARDLAEAERWGEAQGDPTVVHAARALRTVELDADSAVAELRNVLEDARRLGEPEGEIRAASMLGNRLLDLGDARGSRAALDHAWSLASRVGDARGAALATLRLGRVDLAEGMVEDALRRFEEAERGFREIGDHTNAAMTRENRAATLAESGALAESAPLFDEVLLQFRRSGARQHEANALLNLGEVALRSGRMAEARARLEEAAVIARAGGWRAHSGRAELKLGVVEAQVGRAEVASDRWTRAATQLRECGLPYEAAMAEAYRWLLEVEEGSAAPGAASAVLGAVDPRDQPHRWAELGHLLLDRDEESAAVLALEGGHASRAGRPAHRWADAVLAVLAARLAVRDRDPRRAARLLAAADPTVREDWQRVRLHQARAEIWLAHPDAAKAAAAARDAVASAERAGFGAATGLRRALDQLVARTGG